MELRDYMRLLRRHMLLIAATGLIVVGGAAVYTATAAAKYQSSARLFVTTSPSDAQDAFQGGQFSVQRVTSYADLVMSSHQLAESVIVDLNLPLTTAELLDMVATEVEANTVVLTISVTDTNASRARAIAQAYAENLTGLVQTLETPPGQTVPPIKATIVDAATNPTSPVSPRPARNLSLGLIFGLALGFCLALLRDFLDTTVKTQEDVDETVAVPVLGAIPFDSSARSQPLITALDSHAPRVEAFRVLRTNMQFVDVDASQKVFIVTSGLPEEGKTTTAVNLAITLAQAGVRTLLLEADLRRPRAHLALEVDGDTGVTSVLTGKVAFRDAVQAHAGTGLFVLASGPVPPNPADLLQSKAMSDLMEAARAEYEVVIIDAPPLLPVTDAALLAVQADGALMVVRYGKTTRDQLKKAHERLLQVDTRLVGALLNMVPGASLRSGYGYGYAPHTQTSPSRRRKVARR